MRVLNAAGALRKMDMRPVHGRGESAVGNAAQHQAIALLSIMLVSEVDSEVPVRSAFHP
jgi:hypothetical protein